MPRRPIRNMKARTAASSQRLQAANAPPRAPGHVGEIHLKQMAAYRAVLNLIYPDKPVRCLLLWTDGPSLMALDGAVLDDHAP